MAEIINFTKNNLTKIAIPVKGKIEYRDKSEKGLILAASYGGSKVFYLYKKVDGKPERIRIGEFPYFSVEDARNKAIDLKTQIAKGFNPALEKKIKAAISKSELTFKQLQDRYMNDYAKHNVITWRAIELQMNRQASSLYARKLSSITKDDLLQIFNDLTNKVSKASANRFLIAISSIFNKGIEWGLLDKNLASLIKKHPANEPRIRYITQKEMPRFFEAVQNEPNKVVADLILTALYTGARSNNVRSMRFEDVNFADNTWRIARTKNGKPQEIYLTPEVMAILTRRKSEIGNDIGFVFPSSRTKSGYIGSIHKPWHKLCKRADITGLNPHDLRRTYGTWARKITGADRETIGRILLHDSRESTAIYDIIENSFLQKVRIDTTKAISSFGVASYSTLQFLWKMITIRKKRLKNSKKNSSD